MQAKEMDDFDVSTLSDCPLSYSSDAIRATIPRALLRVNDLPRPPRDHRHNHRLPRRGATANRGQNVQPASGDSWDGSRSGPPPTAARPPAGHPRGEQMRPAKADSAELYAGHTSRQATSKDVRVLSRE